jgi:hypothetical protein
MMSGIWRFRNFEQTESGRDLGGWRGFDIPAQPRKADRKYPDVKKRLSGDRSSNVVQR